MAGKRDRRPHTLWHIGRMPSPAQTVTGIEDAPDADKSAVETDCEPAFDPFGDSQ